MKKFQCRKINISKLCKNIFLIAMSLVIICATISYASTLIDKQGRVIEEIIKPTAESTIDPDTISDAVRYIADGAKDYTDSDYEGPSQNIYSNGYIYQFYEEIKNDENKEYTTIRHTPSITDVDEDRYYLNYDVNKDRLRLTIIISNVGKFEAKNGFYKIKDKTYYFDEDGLMVLGPCLDDIGNYYFFSYDTGELVDEIQVR